MKYSLATVLLLGVSPLAAFAQASGAAGYSEQDLMLYGIIGLLALLILATAGLVYSVFSLMKFLKDPEGALAESEAEETSFWQRFNTKFNDAVPLEREEEVLTDHEYDGIHELDNNLPPWWKYMFYATIVFAVGYLASFHMFGLMDSQAEAFEVEMLEAELSRKAYLASAANLIDETNVALMTDEAGLEAGKTLYLQHCMPCHAKDGGGGVGPNLTDPYWLHGGTIHDVFSTVKYGVQEKGMISWESILTPQQMQEVSSYVISLQGTEPANPKEPQGKMVAPVEPETVTDEIEVTKEPDGDVENSNE
ncbi:cbb3-type cytochrome c oxidase N-terminal domain-containing protein [Roseivirga sp. BDSF3-8]|uniref:cbb3-type cytochrome c oxidase N-terminal domain-containing protein n=1 Tax=Roseivirga sp. BDSF3-8 TaxID=3241598 RepID=UPI003531C6EC